MWLYSSEPAPSMMGGIMEGAAHYLMDGVLDFGGGKCKEGTSALASKCAHCRA